MGNGGATNHGFGGKQSKQESSHRNARNRNGIGAAQGGAVLVSLLIARAESDLPSNAASLADAIGNTRSTQSVNLRFVIVKF